MEFTKDQMKRILVNPFYAIDIPPIFCEPHEKLVSEAEWIKANMNMIDEIGSEAWLKQLLDVLKGNYVENKE